MTIKTTCSPFWEINFGNDWEKLFCVNSLKHMVQVQQKTIIVGVEDFLKYICLNPTSA